MDGGDQEFVSGACEAVQLGEFLALSTIFLITNDVGGLVETRGMHVLVGVVASGQLVRICTTWPLTCFKASPFEQFIFRKRISTAMKFEEVKHV